MRRTINYKAILILLGTFLVLGVGIAGLHAYQVDRNAHELLDLANRAEEEGNYKDAIYYLAQYRGMMPKDNDATARFGMLLEDHSDTIQGRISAFRVLDGLLVRDPDRDDVRRRVARMMVMLGRYADAQGHIEKLREKAPEDPELLDLLGRCEAGQFRFVEAGEHFAQAAKLAPNDIGIQLDYALLLRGKLDRAEEADKVVAELVERERNTLPVRLAAARYAFAVGQREKAEEHVQYALKEMKSTDVALYLLAAEIARTANKQEEAQAHLEAALKNHPDNSQVRLELARLELVRGKRKESLKHLEPLIAGLPENSNVEELWSLGNVLVEVSGLHEAEQVVDRLRELKDPGAEVRASALQARLLMQKQQWGEARAVLEEIRAGEGRPPELLRLTNLLLAECYGRLNNPDQQAAASQRALDLNPSSPQARQQLVTALLALNKTDQAVKELRVLAGQNPALQGRLAQLLIEQNAQKPTAEQRWEEAERLLSEIEKDKERASEVESLRIRMLLARKEVAEARKLLIKQRDRDPKKIEPWLELAALADVKGSGESALSVLDQAEEKAGKHVEWDIMRARHWAREGKKEALRELPGLEKRLSEYNELDQDRLRGTLASVYAAIGENTKADRYWHSLAEHQKNNLGVRFLLFEKALQAGKEEEAVALLEDIRRIEGKEGSQALFAEASLNFHRARKGDEKALAEAHRILEDLASVRPSWSNVPLMQGQLFDMEKRYDKALTKYQAAVDLGESRVDVLRRVISLLAERGRYAEANALLQRVPESALAGSDLGRMAAELSLASEKGSGAEAKVAHKKALELAKKSVADSKKPSDYIWLGRLANRAEAPEDAEEAFRKACQLDPKDADAWTNLVLFLARTNAKKADAVMAEMSKSLEADKAPLALGVCYEALGKHEEAEKQYRAALASKPDDTALIRVVADFFTRTGHPADAEPLLRRLLDPKTKAPDTAVAYARRMLALSLAERGTYQQFREAQALVEGDDKDLSPNDRRTRALVLATRPEHRKDAIRLFEEERGQDSNIPAPLRFRLAQLYEAEDNWQEARTELLKLVEEETTNAFYLSYVIRAMLRHKESGEALVWMERLNELPINPAAKVELKVQVLQANDKTEEATKVLEDYAKEKDARLEVIAVGHERLGQLEEAEKAYRKLVQKDSRPDNVLLLANFLGRHNRVPEALAVCEKVWDKMTPVRATSSAMALVRNRFRKEYYEPIKTRLDAAVKKSPKVLVLQIFQAELEDMAGHQEQALAYYRHVLEQDPNNVVANNNLAYLLSFKANQHDQAMELITKAIELAGPHSDLLDTRALIHMQTGKPEPALEDLQKALAQAPSAGTYLHLAEAQLMAKNRSAAEEALDKAKKLGLNEQEVPEAERAGYDKLVKELER